MISICLNTYSNKNLYVCADQYVLFMFTNSHTYIYVYVYCYSCSCVIMKIL